MLHSESKVYLMEKVSSTNQSVTRPFQHIAVDYEEWYGCENHVHIPLQIRGTKSW